MHVSGLSSPLTGLGRQLHPASPKRSPTAKKHFAAGPLLSNVKSPTRGCKTVAAGIHQSVFDSLNVVLPKSPARSPRTSSPKKRPSTSPTTKTKNKQSSSVALRSIREAQAHGKVFSKDTLAAINFATTKDLGAPLEPLPQQDSVKWLAGHDVPMGGNRKSQNSGTAAEEERSAPDRTDDMKDTATKSLFGGKADAMKKARQYARKTTSRLRSKRQEKKGDKDPFPDVQKKAQESLRNEIKAIIEAEKKHIAEIIAAKRKEETSVESVTKDLKQKKEKLLADEELVMEHQWELWEEKTMSDIQQRHIPNLLQLEDQEIAKLADRIESLEEKQQGLKKLWNRLKNYDHLYSKEGMAGRRSGIKIELAKLHDELRTVRRNHYYRTSNRKTRAENAAKALAHSLAKQEIARQSESHLLEQKRELQESHSKAQQEIDRLERLETKRRREEENRIAFQIMQEQKKASHDKIAEKHNKTRDQADIKVQTEKKLRALQEQMDKELEEKLREVIRGGKQVTKKQVFRSNDLFTRAKLSRLKKDIREESSSVHASIKNRRAQRSQSLRIIKEVKGGLVGDKIPELSSARRWSRTDVPLASVNDETASYMLRELSLRKKASSKRLKSLQNSASSVENLMKQVEDQSTTPQDLTRTSYSKALTAMEVDLLLLRSQEKEETQRKLEVEEQMKKLKKQSAH